MAFYNEANVGRYNRLIQKLFQLKGSGPRPAAPIEIGAALALFHGAENRYLEAWNRFGWKQSQTAGGAGVLAKLRLRNPVGSTVIAVIEKALVAVRSNEFAILQTGTTSLDLGGVVSSLQMRFDARGAQQTGLILSQENTATAVAFGATKAQVDLLANTAQDFIATDIQEIPLLPGDAVHIESVLGNSAVEFSLWWRERHLEESERT
jgi:hypothetical protein